LKGPTSKGGEGRKRGVDEMGGEKGGMEEGRGGEGGEVRERRPFW